MLSQHWFSSISAYRVEYLNGMVYYEFGTIHCQFQGYQEVILRLSKGNTESSQTVRLVWLYTSGIFLHVCHNQDSRLPCEHVHSPRTHSRV